MSDKPIVKEYSNGEVTIVWKPDLCIHSEKCFKGLPEVFDPNRRPWIQPEAASTEAIIAQVKQCPSGALTYYMNQEGQPDTETEESDAASHTEVEVVENGPLMVRGQLKIKMADGQQIERSQATAFCRCGASRNKPFCDGSHNKIDFEG